MINIIMLTHNRPKLLRQALVTLYDTTPEDEFTLTVVDDESDDLVADSMLWWLSNGNKNMTRVKVTNSGHVLAQLKNLGVAWSQSRFSRGDYLLLTDNDVAFLPGWWKHMPTVMSDNPLLEVLGGSRHPFHGVNRAHNGWDEVDAVAGTSQLMCWYTWDYFGPLKGGAPGTCQSEDFAFCQKVKARAQQVGYMHIPCILDCGITQTNGQPSPGADVKPRMAGYYYE